MERVIGIDLGTSNSCVAVMDGENAIVIPDGDGARTQASVVSFFPDGRTVVGNEAREQMIYNPKNTIYSSKRLIGRPFSAPEVQTTDKFAAFEILEGPNASVLAEFFGKQYSMPDIAAKILMKMKNIAEAFLGEKVSKAVVTVPANFNDGQRNATKKAGEAAGLDVIRILNEPTAAALAYGFGQSYDQRITVYDFGGGTFDITMLDIHDDVFEVISTAGDTFLGGDDIDTLIVNMIVNSYRKNYNIDLRADPIALLRIRYEAERIKRHLSAEDQGMIRIPSLTTTDQGVVDLNVALSRDNFNAVAKEVIQRSFVICDEALNLARMHTSEIENVILVGGTTHIPLLRQMVEEYFDHKPYWGVNPEEVVALGAAIQGAVLSGTVQQGDQSADAVLLDVTALTLGVATIAGRVEPIVERNTPIPVERSRLFTTSRDYQKEVRLRIYQGESTREEENELMGVLELAGLDPTKLRGEAEIEVSFEIDTDGIVQVRAKDSVTGTEASADIDLHGEAPTEILSEDLEYDENLPVAAEDAEVDIDAEEIEIDIEDGAANDPQKD